MVQTAPLAAEDAASAPEGGNADAASARADLAGGLTEVLGLPEGRQTANERTFAAEILGATLRNAPLGERVRVAARLAAVGGPPPGLTRQLLLDEASVADPLLRRLTTLPDSLLIEAAAVSREHRLLIAGRDGVSEAVADAVLAENEPDVFALLLASEAPVSHRRMDAGVLLSRTAPALVPLLLGRPELQLPQALTLFWWVDGATRRRLLTRFAVDREVMQDTLQPLFARVFTDPEADPLVRRLLHVIDRRHRPRGRDGEMVEMEVVERTLTVARATPSPELCEALGLLAGVGTPCATQALNDPGGEPFAILTKSIGVSRRAFAGILEGASVMAPGEGPTATEAGRERMMACFDIVGRDYARAALRLWDWRPDGGLAANAPAAPVAKAKSDSGYLGAL